MKFRATIIIVLFTSIFYSASGSKHDETATIQNNDNRNNNVATSKMKITIGKTVFAATLYDNPSASAFKAMLPLTIDMTELNGNEKYYDLSRPLPTNASFGGNIKAGDLTLYGNNTLVLFYTDFNTSYSYTKLGSVDNSNGLTAALGSGNAVVTIEKN